MVEAPEHRVKELRNAWRHGLLLYLRLERSRSLLSPTALSTRTCHLSSGRRLRSATRPELAETPVERVTENRLKTVGLFAAVFLTAASGTFAVAYLRARRSTTMLTVPRIIQEVPVRSPRLGMRPRRKGTPCFLAGTPIVRTYNRLARGCCRLMMVPNTGEIALDRGGIASDSMVYRPISDDVVFRLEIRGSDGVRAAESLEVVGTHTRSADFEAQPVANTLSVGKTSSVGAVTDRPKLKEQPRGN